LSSTTRLPISYFALIPAAGVGARMAAGSPKQYLAVAGKPMLRHALDAFASAPAIAHTYVVVSAEDDQIDAVLPPSGVTALRQGGATRMETILNALRALAGVIADDDWVLVHDAARPGLTAVLIAKLIDAVGDDAVGGLLALPVVDTVKRAAANGEEPGFDTVKRAAANCEATVGATVSRDGLWLAQTPQMFRYQLLLRALEAAESTPALITDDASAVEALGFSPRLVEGHPRNLKVTLPADIRIAEMYLDNPTFTSEFMP
jgi:2-C-methyl-D-erythritol 4-phosphate cytidylyltransferase